MMYQKLVRDNIPAIIEKSGETCVTRKLTDKEYEDALAENCKKRSRSCWKPTQPRNKAFWTVRKKWRM